MSFMNLSNMTDEDLEKKKKEYKKTVSDILSRNLKDDLPSALLMSYGTFVCIFNVIFWVQYGLSQQGWVSQVLNYFFIISGSVTLCKFFVKLRAIGKTPLTW